MKTAKVTVRVPATSANLGPGFDCLGMALDLFNTVTVETAQEIKIEVRGEGSDSLSRRADNLVYRSALALFQASGKGSPKLAIECQNQIPLARGLGSSAAAVVGGLVGANILAGEPLTRQRLLKLATEIEGHTDNVAPALMGGCQIVVKDGDRIVTSQVPVAKGLKAVIFVPDFPMSTQRARGVLPDRYPRGDVIFNLGRVALLVNALGQGTFEDLRIATQDRLHQRYRESLFPQMRTIIERVSLAGAVGVFLSGAGSSILALGKEADRIELAMSTAAREAGVSGKTMIRSICPTGAEVLKS